MPRDGMEIAPETGRRKRASGLTTSNISMPASALNTIGNEGGDDAQHMDDTHNPGGIVAVVDELVSLQRKRQFCIVQQSRADRSIESLIASAIGFRLDATEKDRKAAFAKAKAYRLAIEKGGEGHLDGDTQAGVALSAIKPLILASAAGRKTWDDLKSAAVKDMERLTKSLPVYGFAKSVRGFGSLGLACIVAEAGIPIGEYRTVSGLWKRMGLAVFDGKRQQRCRDKDEAARHGYSPKRRSEVWAFGSDSMFRQQWNADRDEDGNKPDESGKPVAVPAHPSGPYGEVYARRRATTDLRIEATAELPASSPDKWTKARCHNDARRVMTKALLRDLWRVWNGMPPRGDEIIPV